jgi:hypothetical protein
MPRAVKARMGDTLAAGDPADGLCATCRYARIVRSDRGSQFYLCERSRSDPSYAMYPRLPVLECGGFEPESESLKADQNPPE